MPVSHWSRDEEPFMKNVPASVIAAAFCTTLSFAPLCRVNGADAPASSSVQSSNDPSTQVQGEIEKGLEFLKSQQRPDGSWQAEGEPPALTAIALRAFVGDPKYADQDFVKKGFEKLLSFQKEDGSISSDVLATYNTAIATSALAKSNDPKYKAAADKAVAYLQEHRVDGQN